MITSGNSLKSGKMADAEALYDILSGYRYQTDPLLNRGSFE